MELDDILITVARVYSQMKTPWCHWISLRAASLLVEWNLGLNGDLIGHMLFDPFEMTAHESELLKTAIRAGWSPLTRDRESQTMFSILHFSILDSTETVICDVCAEFIIWVLHHDPSKSLEIFRQIPCQVWNHYPILTEYIAQHPILILEEVSSGDSLWSYMCQDPDNWVPLLRSIWAPTPITVMCMAQHCSDTVGTRKQHNYFSIMAPTPLHLTIGTTHL